MVYTMDNMVICTTAERAASVVFAAHMNEWVTNEGLGAMVWTVDDNGVTMYDENVSLDVVFDHVETEYARVTWTTTDASGDVLEHDFMYSGRVVIWGDLWDLYAPVLRAAWNSAQETVNNR